MTPTRPDLDIKRPQRGMGVIAAMVVLVFLAALAAAIVRLNFTEQVSSGQGLAVARAGQAASSGMEYGLYQVLKGSWSTCPASPTTIDLSADFGMKVTLTCSMISYSEGESAEGTAQTVKLYALDAVACSTGSASCPDNTRVGSPGYVERKRSVQFTN
jgi:MSHA biogenesis protein MshP